MSRRIRGRGIRRISGISGISGIDGIRCIPIERGLRRRTLRAQPLTRAVARVGVKVSA